MKSQQIHQQRGFPSEWHPMASNAIHGNHEEGRQAPELLDAGADNEMMAIAVRWEAAGALRAPRC
jgi:hypothetical protein